MGRTPLPAAVQVLPSGASQVVEVQKPVIREVEICGLRSSTNLGIDLQWARNGLYVAGLSPSGKAYNSGVYIGDEILEINGTAMTPAFGLEVIYDIMVSRPVLNMIVRGGPAFVSIDKPSPNTPSGIICRDGMVAEVQPGSPASRHRTIHGQSIMAVNGKSMVGRPDREVQRHVDNPKTTRLELMLLDSELLDDLHDRVEMGRLNRPNSLSSDIFSRSLDSLMTFRNHIPSPSPLQ